MSQWLPLLKPDRQTRLRLFCFPFAGGGAQFFYPWAELLNADIDVCPIMLPGREKMIRSQPYGDMQQLVPVLTEHLQTAMDIPFVFFGHSMGALIAYNVACYLAHRGKTLPLHIFCSAMYPPRHLPTEPVVHNLPRADFIKALKTFNGTPQSVLEREELMEVMLPYLRADFQLIETYRHREYSTLPVPFSVYGGAEDTITRRDLLLWKEETSSSFQCKIFPGDHFYLNNPRQLLQHMNKELHRLTVQIENTSSNYHHSHRPRLGLN